MFVNHASLDKQGKGVLPCQAYGVCNRGRGGGGGLLDTSLRASSDVP